MRGSGPCPWEPPGGTSKGWLWPLLYGAERLFRAGIAAREAAYRHGWRVPHTSELPVISVGGIEVGGVGKTPLVLELMRLARGAGLRPAILSRGYRGRLVRRETALRVPLPLPPRAAEDYGDEPAWLAEEAERLGGAGVWVARNRGAAAAAARAAGADLALLDDGFQHRSLRRDADVVALSGLRPWGNGHLLPLGPLREPPRALERARRIVLTGADATAAAATRELIGPFLAPATEVFSWRGEPDLVPALGPPLQKGEPFILLAGIAHPERLLDSLRLLGRDPSEVRFFPDHHLFRESDLGLEAWNMSPGRPAAEYPGARPQTLVTTEKDWMRLRPLLDSLRPELGGRAGAAAGFRVVLLRLRIVWNEPGAEEAWRNWILRLVTRAGSVLPDGAHRNRDRPV